MWIFVTSSYATRTIFVHRMLWCYGKLRNEHIYTAKRREIEKREKRKERKEKHYRSIWTAKEYSIHSPIVTFYHFTVVFLINKPYKTLYKRMVLMKIEIKVYFIIDRIIVAICHPCVFWIIEMSMDKYVISRGTFRLSFYR